MFYLSLCWCVPGSELARFTAPLTVECVLSCWVELATEVVGVSDWIGGVRGGTKCSESECLRDDVPLSPFTDVSWLGTAGTTNDDTLIFKSGSEGGVPGYCGGAVARVGSAAATSKTEYFGYRYKRRTKYPLFKHEVYLENIIKDNQTNYLNYLKVL